MIEMAKIENSITPKVGVIMGSVSDWETMKEACDVLDQLQEGSVHHELERRN